MGPSLLQSETTAENPVGLPSNCSVSGRHQIAVRKTTELATFRVPSFHGVSPIESITSTATPTATPTMPTGVSFILTWGG